MATRHNPVLKTFYPQLRDRGKPAQQALTVWMCQPIVILNVMIKHHTLLTTAVGVASDSRRRRAQRAGVTSALGRVRAAVARMR